MADLLYVVIMIALTALGVLFVIGCDRLIGPDEPALAEKTGTRAESERQIEELAA